VLLVVVAVAVVVANQPLEQQAMVVVLEMLVEMVHSLVLQTQVVVLGQGLLVMLRMAALVLSYFDTQALLRLRLVLV
jgi:hypothetical protein